MRNLHFLSSTAALLLWAGFSPGAEAAFVSVASGPANYCQPAMPVYGGLIRVRPAAIQNDGTTNAFVTCSMPTEIALNDPASRTGSFVITVGKTLLTPVEVACTAVATAEGGSGQTITRRATVTTAAPTHLSWFARDFANGAMPELVSFSCLLPPGGAITATRLTMKDGARP